MVSAGPIRERSRMIGKANVETSQFVKNLASPCVASQKSKNFRQMHELKLRMTVPCLAVLHSSSVTSVAVTDLLLTAAAIDYSN